MHKRTLLLGSLAALTMACGGSDDVAPVDDTGVDAAIDSTVGDIGTDSSDSGSDTGTDSRGDLGVDAPRTDADVGVDSGDSGDTGTPITPLSPGDAGCTVTKGDADKLYVTGVALLQPAPLAAGELLVVGDKITCVGASCASATGASTATKIACTKGIVLPGYVDAHNHVDWNVLPTWRHSQYFEDRYQWRGSDAYSKQIAAAHTAIGGALECPAVKYAEVRAIVGGTTSIQGTAVSAGAIPCISGLVRNIDLGGTAAALGVGPAETDINMVTSIATAKTERDNVYTSGKSIAYIPHVGEGYDRPQRGEFDADEGHSFYGSKSAFIHSAGGRAREYVKMAATGTKLIWSPRSNLELYGDTAHVAIAKHLGIEIALGCDWSPSGSWQMTEELRCAREVDETSMGKNFTEDDLIFMATAASADAVGVGDKVGRLAVGYVADFQIVSGDITKPSHSAIEAGPNETALVVIGGKPQYGEAKLLDALVDTALCDDVPLCAGVTKKVCVRAVAADDTLPALTKKLSDALVAAKAKAAVADQFEFEVAPFARCVLPFTCKLGNDAYTGKATTGDSDGDGTPDTKDNCPTLFNPHQDDFDVDGKGDECDECPNKAGTDCGLTDLDGDGTPNATDVCPFTAGTTADVCAPCGTATTACAIDEIATLRDPSKPIRIEVGANGAFKGLTVLGLWKSGTNNGAFLQSALGNKYGGLFYFNGTAAAPTVAVGDIVDVAGQYTVFDGLAEMQKSTTTPLTLTKTGTGTDPTPTLVSVSEIWTGGPRFEELVGTLIELHDVAVRADTTFPEVNIGDDAGAFGGTLRLAGSAYGLAAPCAGTTFTKPTVGTKYAKIVGLLDRRNSLAKILPRCASELVTK